MNYYGERGHHQVAYNPSFLRIPVENYMKAGELRKLLEVGVSTSSILSKADEHCDNRCKEPTNLNAFLYCNENCPLWDIKNKIRGNGKA